MEAEILMRLARVEARYNELNDEMTQPEALSDHVRLTAMAREQTELGELVSRYREYQQIERSLEEARALLREESDPDLREIMTHRAHGRRTVPQIFIGDTHVGGYDDMAALDRRGGLDPLLAQ